MRLPFGLKWLCAHRWRQTYLPRCYPSAYQREWVCLDCRKRKVMNMTQFPIIYIPPGQHTGREYDEVLPL